MSAKQTDCQDEALIGVVVVMFNSAREIGACVRTLLASEGAALRIILIDNASEDDGAAVAEREATAAGVGFTAVPASAINQLALADISPVTLIRSMDNLGFAGGCNLSGYSTPIARCCPIRPLPSGERRRFRGCLG
jgi:GT2 family glycosyltransferase